MSILAPSIGILWQVIESYGLDPEPYFAHEGIEIHWPVEPGTRLPYEAVDRIRARAAADSGDAAFGLRAAQFVHPSQLGALGYVFLASPTLRSAFVCMQRYIRVLNDRARFEVDVRDGRVVTSLSVEQDTENEVARDDAQIAYLLTLCRINAGRDFNPVEVWFRHGEPGDANPYAALFRCPVTFGAERNALAVTRPVRPLSRMVRRALATCSAEVSSPWTR